MMSNVYDIYDKLEDYNRRLTEKKLALQDAKRTNNEIDKLEPAIQKSETLLKVLDEYYNAVNLLNKLSNIEDTNYRERRMGFLESFIDEKLSIIFPEEDFRCKIRIEMRYNKPRVSLKIIDPLGIERLPHMSEGNLLQELIGFSSSIAITECLGSNKFYIDEAFAASSPENLTKISNIIEEANSNGMQMILIAQNNDVYKDIPRREIHLHKDPIYKKVSITKIIDY